MKIKLTKGYFVSFDKNDYPLIKPFKWHACVGIRGHVYAKTNIRVDGKQKKLAMHRLIIGATSEQNVDHKDGDTLNNSRNNLRICSQRENVMNTRARRASGLKGAYFVKRLNKYQAMISANKKQIYLGLYLTEVEAARAYNLAAKRYHGDFARLNKV